MFYLIEWLLKDSCVKRFILQCKPLTNLSVIWKVAIKYQKIFSRSINIQQCEKQYSSPNGTEENRIAHTHIRTHTHTHRLTISSPKGMRGKFNRDCILSIEFLSASNANLHAALLLSMTRFLSQVPHIFVHWAGAHEFHR